MTESEFTTKVEQLVNGEISQFIIDSPNQPTPIQVYRNDDLPDTITLDNLHDWGDEYIYWDFATDFELNTDESGALVMQPVTITRLVHRLIQQIFHEGGDWEELTIIK